MAALNLQAEENVIPLLLPFNANEAKGDCDLYLWEFFLVHSYQKPQPGSNRKEGNREAKRDGERERKNRNSVPVGQRMSSYSGDGGLTCWPSGKGDVGSIPGLEDLLEEEMATRSSVLARENPRTEEPVWLQSVYTSLVASVMSDSLRPCGL